MTNPTALICRVWCVRRFVPGGSVGYLVAVGEKARLTLPSVEEVRRRCQPEGVDQGDRRDPRPLGSSDLAGWPAGRRQMSTSAAVLSAPSAAAANTIDRWVRLLRSLHLRLGGLFTWSDHIPATRTPSPRLKIKLSHVILRLPDLGARPR